MKQEKWSEQEEPEVEYGELNLVFLIQTIIPESDRDHDQFDGEDMKVAKNVENLGDAAYVKAKGTWYRARKCHKVRAEYYTQIEQFFSVEKPSRGHPP